MYITTHAIVSSSITLKKVSDHYESINNQPQKLCHMEANFFNWVINIGDWKKLVFNNYLKF